MKKLKRILNKISGMIIHFTRFIFLAWRHREKTIYVFDLDNTLGNTYPTLINRNFNELERLKNIEPFERMCRLANSIAQSPSRTVFVLTARQYSTQQVTEKWIENAGIAISAAHIFIVLSPMQKVWLLHVASFYCKRIVFIDDMSFNHENGVVKFYEKAINALPKRVKYIGYATIKKFNASTFFDNA